MVKDREDTLVGLTAGAGEVIALAAELSADRIVKLRAYVGNPDTGDAPATAHTLARLTQSLLLTPDGPPRLGHGGPPEGLRRRGDRPDGAGTLTAAEITG